MATDERPNSSPSLEMESSSAARIRAAREEWAVEVQKRYAKAALKRKPAQHSVSPQTPPSVQDEMNSAAKKPSTLAQSKANRTFEERSTSTQSEAVSVSTLPPISTNPTAGSPPTQSSALARNGMSSVSSKLPSESIQPTASLSSKQQPSSSIGNKANRAFHIPTRSRASPSTETGLSNQSGRLSAAKKTPAPAQTTVTTSSSGHCSMSSTNKGTDSLLASWHPRKRKQSSPPPNSARKVSGPFVLDSDSEDDSARVHQPGTDRHSVQNPTKPIKTNNLRRVAGEGSSRIDTGCVEMPDTDRPSPPDWYNATAFSNARGRGGPTYPSTVDTLFQSIRTAITHCETQNGRPLLQSNLDKISDGIHRTFFITFTDEKNAKAAIRKNRMLHNEDGLPRLFNLSGSQLPQYPFYIVADAKELYTKWWMGIFDTGLYRGILKGKKKDVRLDRDGQADRLDPTYAHRVSGRYHGNGSLLNGQWWPIQLSAVRDGAHNSAQAGICGAAGQGAWSITVAGNEKYPDIDNGEELWYCGTEGDKGAVSASTQRMLESVENQLPVRVIRSENGKNPTYRPVKGYRYDGLYVVLDSELINAAKFHYRFHLRRLPGQDPIRYKGPECRPTKEELAEYEKTREERKFLV